MNRNVFAGALSVLLLGGAAALAQAPPMEKKDEKKVTTTDGTMKSNDHTVVGTVKEYEAGKKIKVLVGKKTRSFDLDSKKVSTTVDPSVAVGSKVKVDRVQERRRDEDDHGQSRELRGARLDPVPRDVPTGRPFFWLEESCRRRAGRMHGTELRIPWATLLKISAGGLAAWACVHLWRFAELLLFAALIAIALSPAVRMLERRRVSRERAVVLLALVPRRARRRVRVLRPSASGGAGLEMWKSLPAFRHSIARSLESGGLGRAILLPLLDLPHAPEVDAWLAQPLALGPPRVRGRRAPAS